MQNKKKGKSYKYENWGMRGTEGTIYDKSVNISRWNLNVSHKLVTLF